MKYVLAAALAPLFAGLAACSGGDGNTTSAAPVAAVAAPASQPWADTVTKTEEGYLLGNPNAPVKLVEYGARLCPGCKAFALEGFEPLIKNYVSSGKVSFEFRDFIIHGPAELGLALLGQCGDKSTFFPVLEQTFQGQDALNQAMMAVSPAQQQALAGGGPVATITGWTQAIGGMDFMKQRGLTEAKARQCLADQTQIDAVTAITQKRGADGTVTGTPTLIVNGDKVNGGGWADVEKALKAAGA